MGEGALLVHDEIQKIDNWSEIIKKLWDASRIDRKRLKVVLLGSSSLALQIGLSESLTGRFELIRVFHWNYGESQQAFGHSPIANAAQCDAATHFFRNISNLSLSPIVPSLGQLKFHDLPAKQDAAVGFFVR